MIERAATGHDSAILRAVLDASLDAVIAIDATGKIVEFSAGAERTFGYRRDEVIGRSLAETIVPPELRAAHTAALARLVDTGESRILGQRLEIEALRRNGERFPIELTVTQASVDPPLFTAFLRDTSDRRRNEAALQRSQARLATLVASLYAGVLLEDENRHILLANQRFCQIFRIPAPPESLTGADCAQMATQTALYFADPVSFTARVTRILAEQRQVENEELTLADGRTLERDYVPIFVDGAFAGHLWVYRDTTERKAHEASRRRDASLMAALSEASLQFVADGDIDTAFGLLHESLLELTQSEYGFVGEVLRDEAGTPFVKTHALSNIAWNPETQALWNQHAPNFEFTNLNTLFGAVLTGGRPVIANAPANDPRRGGLPEGHPPLESFLGVPIFRADEMIGIFGIANRPGGYTQATIDYLHPFCAACANIIAAYRHDQLRREAEEALRSERDFTSAVLNTAGALVLVLDRQGAVVSFNRTCEETTLRPAADVIGRRLWEMPFFPDDQREETHRTWSQFDQLWRPNSHEASWFQPDGNKRRIAWTTTALRDPRGNVSHVLWTGIDITDRRTAEKEREEALQHLSEANHFIGRITDTAPMLIYLYDFVKRQTVYSNRSLSDLLDYPATPPGDLLSDLIHPDDRPLLAHHFRALNASETNQVHEFECRLRAADGQWRWFHSRYTVFQRGRRRGVRQILGAAVDVTERKRAEEQLQGLTQELRRSNQALQDFASIASHDLQEPLRKIQAFGGRLRSREAQRLGPDSLDYLERMLAASERMQTLIDDLLTYSRITSKAQPFVQVDLNAIVAEVLSDLEVRLQQNGGRVDVALLPSLEADPLQMRQLFQNLIGNALKFHRVETPPRVQIVALPGATPDWARIEVRDNGIGFEPCYAERIFEVFERLHERSTYAGTGMGLAICRKIVLRHHGDICATGTPGEGATFTLDLPYHQRGDGGDAR